MTPQSTKRNAPWAVLAAVAALAALFHQRDVLNLANLHHVLPPGDGDNWLRLTQVRQWMTGGDFFDHSVARTNAPFGGITLHWTRPVDSLLAVLARLMPGGIEQKLMLAAAWLPVMLGLAAAMVLAKGAEAVRTGFPAAWLVVVLVLMNSAAPTYFAPGTADHHGALALLWCGVLALLMRPPSAREGLSVGLLLGMMLWISVESLLLIAPVYALLGLWGLREPREMRTLSAASMGAALVAAAGLLVEMPADKIYTGIVYDSLSLPYAVLLSLCAGMIVLLDAAFQKMPDLKTRAGAAAVSVLAIGLVMLRVFPEFFRGPLGGADPFIATDFLPSIAEALPLHTTFLLHRSVFIGAVWQPGLALFLILALRRTHFFERHGRQLAVLCLLLGWTFALTAAMVRWSYYLQPVAIVLIAALLPSWSALKMRFGTRKFRPYAVLYLACLAAAGGMALSNAAPGDSAVCQTYILYDIETGRLRRELGEKPLVLLTEADYAGAVMFFTPYRVIAGNYNREGADLRALDGILKAPTAEAALPLLRARKVDALLLCPGSYKEGWAAGLGEEKGVPRWLLPVKGLNAGEKNAALRPRLFRVHLPPPRNRAINPP